MKIYLINLAIRPDRLRFMKAQLDAQGLPFTRIDAINGLGDENIGYPANHPRLSKGEYACYLSHVKCWEAFIASGDKHCLVLEDDIKLSKHFSKILNHAPFFSHRGAITRLECRPFRTRVSKFWRYRFEGHKLRKITAFDGAAGALVLTREYASYILKHHKTPEIPVDDLLLDRGSTNYRPHRVYQLDPAPATQMVFLQAASIAGDGLSDLQKGRTPAPEKSLRPTGYGVLLSEIAQLGKNIWNNLFHTFKTIPFRED